MGNSKEEEHEPENGIFFSQLYLFDYKKKNRHNIELQSPAGWDYDNMLTRRSFYGDINRFSNNADKYSDSSIPLFLTALVRSIGL